MDWQLLGLSFSLVFLSELGDKSQLAAITLGGNARSPRVAFFGIAAGLVFTSFLGVLLGDGVAQLLPTPILKAIAAIGFAVMGFSLLWQPQPELIITIEETNPQPKDEQYS
jgi:putative Ca2+/H+ antiporter (TMEM165/GDT1 family)